MQRRITIINLVEPEAGAVIKKFGDRLKHYIDTFINRFDGEILHVDIFKPLHEKKMDLWLILANDELVAFATTEYVIRKDKPRICHVAYCGGEKPELWVNEFIHFLSEKVAPFQKCDKLRLTGRLGWKKYLPDWKTTYIVLEKSL